jgi:glycosidase
MMRLGSLVPLVAMAFWGCSAGEAGAPSERDAPEVEGDRYPGSIAGSTIYEVNIRQHTPEGTLRAFMEDLPRIRGLGVDVLWIMPVQPIGEENRKGSLGSYYSVRDYRAVNPEFGTAEDFRRLVEEVHALDMRIILDWVPNHTAWDHPWITEHPEFYATDSLGNITYEADWTDIALLDHRNPATRAAMIEEMAYWVREYDIDGFRQDHAGHEIPLYFWEEATEAIDAIKDVFWLAEWDGARMHNAFDATYAWELLHLQDSVARGEADAHDLARFIQADIREYGRRPFRLMMTTNHDENSWNGTVFERYGRGHETFAVFVFTAYGIPMVYGGQEAGLDKRLRFFEKDTVDFADPMGLQPFYRSLIELKKDNPALWAGEYGGVPVRINDDDHVYAFKRQKDGNQVIVVLNFSGEDQTVRLTDDAPRGTHRDHFTGLDYDLGEGVLQLEPWQYLVFTSDG